MCPSHRTVHCLELRGVSQGSEHTTPGAEEGTGLQQSCMRNIYSQRGTGGEPKVVGESRGKLGEGARRWSTK